MHGIIVLNRNGRRPTARRQRKKIPPFKSSSPFKTWILWLLFFIFVSCSAVLFFVLLYLDLILRDKNSKELALCCGAFSVCLLTALRIWLSLPDDYSDDRAAISRLHREQITRGEDILSCRLRQNESYVYLSPGRRTGYSLGGLPLIRSPPDVVTIRNEFLISDMVMVEKQDAVSRTPPPAYSTLDFQAELEPPQYEEAMASLRTETP